MAWLNARTPEIETRYGHPFIAETRWAATPFEAELLRRARARGRQHDITLFIRRGMNFAVIRKPNYPPHVYRPPSGGVEPDETLEAGAFREAYEETGLEVVLRVYLLRAHVVFIPKGERDETIPWTTHVFLAEWLKGEPHPVDTKEIAEARWASLEELTTTLQEALDEAPTAGLRYRGWLQRQALSALTAPPTGVIGGERICRLRYGLE